MPPSEQVWLRAGGVRGTRKIGAWCELGGSVSEVRMPAATTSQKTALVHVIMGEAKDGVWDGDGFPCTQSNLARQQGSGVSHVHSAILRPAEQAQLEVALVQRRDLAIVCLHRAAGQVAVLRHSILRQRAQQSVPRAVWVGRVQPAE